MNAKKFSDAMSELDTKYIDEALSYNSQTTSRHFKRKWTVALIAAILALCLMGAGVAAVKIYIDRVASPDAFENIEHHDLSADGTIQISEYIDNGELFMVPDAMTTNKEEISVTNNIPLNIAQRYIFQLFSDCEHGLKLLKIRITGRKFLRRSGKAMDFHFQLFF